jgi:hypothetical protein
VTAPQETYECIGVELATETRPEVPALSYPQYPDTIPWVLVDACTFTGPLMDSACFAVYNNGGTIDYSIPPATLSPLAQVAVGYAPLRFRNELIAAFHRLDTLQDFYADLILNTTLRCVDEVIFQICCIGPEILAYPGFDPELITHNVELMYELDDSLHYANIVDYSFSNGDYYSTVEYSVVDGDDSVWVELPPEIYYYYIVHPIISDEFPDMSAYVYSQFWREYLFYESDSTFPTLVDHIKHAQILWNGERVVLPPGRPFALDDCALDVIGNWASYTVPQAASGNRPIQPNIIAHEHNGNCGELQDLLCAAARACLIPCVCVMDVCEDHVWCEFYDRGLYPYQVDLGFGVTHLADTGVAYDEQYGGSKRVSAIFDWRSDGYWWTVTNTYSNTCSLYAYVYDLMGRPIDGAAVTISSEYYYGGISTSTRAWTDPDGVCSFALGDLRNFYARVTTPIGSYPVNPDEVIQIIQNSQSGARYYKVFYIDDYLPTLRFTDTTCTDTLALWKYEVIVEPIQGLSSGNCVTRYGPGDSIRVYRSFFEKYDMGNIDVLFVDDENLQDYIAGIPFCAHQTCATTGGAVEFIVHDSATYHCIIANQDVIYYTPFCDITVNLYTNPAYGIEEEIVKISPVPGLPTVFNQRILVDFDVPSRVRLYEISGRCIYDSHRAIPLIDYELSAGVYFMRTTTDDEETIGKCVVVR